MGLGLAETAQGLHCSERTLRRYVNEGMLRGERLGRQEVRLPRAEELYLRRHWEVLSKLRRALRTEPAVRLAVLFGSTAVGEDRPDSDVDLLIDHATGDLDDVVRLQRRLQNRVGKPVHLALREDVEQAPSLLADILLEGRVIVDRADGWRRLARQRQEALRQAADEEKRLERILREISAAREQLLAAIEDLSPQFDVAAIQEAMQSGDPRERNKVAVIERELDVLIAYLEELAARGLSEGQRIEAVPGGTGHAIERLAELNVISHAAAQRIQDVKDMRNQLAHAYPPASWRSLHQAVEVLLDELDSYKVKVADWLKSSGILSE